MTWIRYIVVITLLLSVSTIDAQKTNNIKFIVKLKSVEHYGHKLKNSTIYIFKNGIISDSIHLKKNKLKLHLSNGFLYEIEFTKKNYVNKHVIINTIEVPKNKSLRIKADISLFQPKMNWNLDFLNNQPVSIANYNFLKKKLEWDFDYNRYVVEKIILAIINK